jgi:hypothetical protein
MTDSTRAARLLAELTKEKHMTNDIPRRSHMERWTMAERAIYVAVQTVEDLPADVRLTDAVVLLQAARDSVADFVDGVQMRRSVSVVVCPVDAAPTVSEDVNR